MELIEVISKFENRSYWERQEFIEAYDFKDDYQEYYKKFMVDHLLKVQEPLYLSDLIDLCMDLEYYDLAIFEKIQALLFTNKTIVVKLSAISYLEDYYNTNNNQVGLELVFTKLLANRNSRVIKNQLLKSLIACSENKKDSFLEQLLKSIEKTRDWRSIYRILNSLDDSSLSAEAKAAIYNVIEATHKQYDFGKGVDQLLSEKVNK